MSWQTDIENKVFEIITGDGKSYKPKWKNPIKEVEYNVSVFNFINVTGSLIDRRKPKARKFELEFYFDGENSITTGNNFEVSARNTKRWTLKHPFYGDIICQPISLTQDDSMLNCSKFKVQVMETLLEGWPKADEIVSDRIAELETKISGLQVNILPETKIDKVALKASVNTISDTNSAWIDLAEDLTAFKKLVSDAIIAIDKPLFDAVAAVRSVQSVINFPATVQRTVEERINILISGLNGVIDSFNGTFLNKFQVESLGGTYISAINRAASTGVTDEDYYTKSLVFKTQEKILAAFDSYLLFLDSQQTERADSEESYSPDFDNIAGLDDMTNVTLANLYQVAFTAKQERSFICDKDYNPVLLAHRFYGLDDNDINLNRFINENDLGLFDMLRIRKGRTVIYYA